MRLVAEAQASGARVQALADRTVAVLVYVAVTAGLLCSRRMAQGLVAEGVARVFD